TMLGMGRALGETIAVTFIISPFFHARASILANGGHSISALIALNFSESVSNRTARDALIAAGLALFVITLIVNAIASTIVLRSRPGSATETRDAPPRRRSRSAGRSPAVRAAGNSHRDSPLRSRTRGPAGGCRRVVVLLDVGRLRAAHATHRPARLRRDVV